MNKRMIIIITALIVIGGGSAALAVTYSNNRNSASEQNASEAARMEKVTPEAPTAQAETPTTKNKASEKPVTTAGTYVDYSDDVIANTAGKKVLFFHAPWCPQCRAIDSDIKSQSSLPATIIKVDYDSNQDLRQKYGVTLQTTFVAVDDDGNFEQKYVAYNEPNYAAVKQNILE